MFKFLKSWSIFFSLPTGNKIYLAEWKKGIYIKIIAALMKIEDLCF